MGGYAQFLANKGEYSNTMRQSLASILAPNLRDRTIRGQSMASTFNIMNATSPTTIGDLMIESRMANAVNAELNRQLGINLPAATFNTNSYGIIRPVLGFVPKRDRLPLTPINMPSMRLMDGGDVVAQKGMTIPYPTPLKKLDRLLHFTNYNKPTKGGWLDKYN